MTMTNTLRGHLQRAIQEYFLERFFFTYLYLHKIKQTGFKSQVPKTEFSRENPKKLKYQKSYVNIKISVESSSSAHILSLGISGQSESIWRSRDVIQAESYYQQLSQKLYYKYIIKKYNIFWGIFSFLEGHNSARKLDLQSPLSRKNTFCKWAHSAKKWSGY